MHGSASGRAGTHWHAGLFQKCTGIKIAFEQLNSEIFNALTNLIHFLKNCCIKPVIDGAATFEKSISSGA